MNRNLSLRFGVAVLLALLLAGCTAHYRKSADHAAYRVIQQKSPQVPNMDRNFTIERTNVLSLEELPALDFRSGQTVPHLPRAVAYVPPRTPDLDLIDDR